MFVLLSRADWSEELMVHTCWPCGIVIFKDSLQHVEVTELVISLISRTQSRERRDLNGAFICCVIGRKSICTVIVSPKFKEVDCHLHSCLSAGRSVMTTREEL